MVGITAVADLSGPALEGFRARAELPERKHLKLMTRPVRLGVAAIGRVLAARPDWQSVPPDRRGLFVGAVPRGAAEDLGPALEIARAGATVDLARFGEAGIPRLHPLWLVKGLSNNIPGYACAYWDVRGPTNNRCEGRVGGLAAIVEAVRAVEEGHVDLAIAGGADVAVRWTERGPEPGLEGAAFVIVERDRGRPVVDAQVWMESEPDGHADVGAATGAIALVQALRDPGACRTRVADGGVGLSAAVGVAARVGEAGAGNRAS